VINHATGQTTAFTYDGNGALVKKVEPAGTTIYVGSHYEVQSLGGKKTHDVTQLKNGVACQDGATGTGYLLYSAENVHSRFAAHVPYSTNADHFVCVRYSGGWQYDTNDAYYSFTPRSTDVLVAQVDFSNDTVTSLAGQNSTLNGITYGYASGNLTFQANVFAGVSNPGEFYLTGTSLTTHSGGASTLKYYFFGGQRVAMRKDGVVQYLLGDHLGTTSLVLDGSGNKLTESRHLPYGGQRWTADGTLPTDYRWTGQRQDGYINLYIMGARWYDPELGRFLSPDSIVPDFSNPQSLNRYSYAYNNALRYTDPTGHLNEDEIMELFGLDPEEDEWVDVLAHFEEGGDLEGKWGFLGALRDFESLCTLEVWSDDASIGSLTYLDNGYSSEDLLALGKLQATSYSIFDPISTPLSDPNMKSWYNASMQYPGWNFEPGNIDWIDVGVNVVGMAGDAANVVPVYGQIAWGASEGIEIGEALRVAHSNDLLTVIVGEGAFSVGRLAPPPWGTMASMGSILFDLQAGFYLAP
jgi:RHS repeat-associated protein